MGRLFERTGNLKKYNMIVVTSGCSFTNCGKSWPYHINNHDVCNVGTVGAGNSYITRAAIWQCEDLLSNGIPSDEIYLIVMWSGINRKEVLSTNTNPLHSDYISNQKDRWWLSNFNPNIDEKDSVWLKSSIPDMKWTNQSVCDLFEQHWKHFYTEEESLLNTLENIIRIQNYCDSRGIKYKLSCWQNIFNKYSLLVPKGWDYENQEVFAQEIWILTWRDGEHWRDDRYWPKEMTDKISKDSPLLKDLYPQTQHLWDMIEWDNWWFYEDDQVEYGGLAEWVVMGEKHNMGMEHDPAHPSEYSHEQFAKKEVQKWIC